MGSITIELVSNASTQPFPEKRLRSFTNFLPEQLNLESQWEVAILEIYCPSMYENGTEGKYMLFDKRTFKVLWLLLSRTRSLPLHYRFCWSHDTITAKNVTQLNCLEKCKKLRFTLRMKDLVLHSLVRTWDTFSVAFLAMNLEWCWEERTSQTSICLLHCIHPLIIYTDTIEYNTFGETKASLLRCFPFISQLKARDIMNTGLYMN